MRKFALVLLSGIIFTGNVALSQGIESSKTDSIPKKKLETSRASPQATSSITLTNGSAINILYGQPSLKNRTVGKDIAPFDKIWRTGANEATIFETSKNVKVSGKLLPAGKYSLYTIPGEKEWTVIFNRVWDQWGTKYNTSEDQLRVVVKPLTADQSTEMFTILLSKDGQASLNWGKVKVPFTID